MCDAPNSARRGGVLPNKKAPFSRSLFVGINHTFVPSLSKGRKCRGGSANAETVFARTPRENIARGRRETVAESSPARDVSAGQGAAAFFQMKKAPFFEGAFMLLLNRTFVPSLSKGRKHRGGKSECRDGFRPIEAREHRPRTQGDGRREQPGERCFVRARRGGVLPNKKGSFFQEAFLLVSIALLFHPYPKGGNAVGQRECRDAFSPDRGVRTSPADTGRRSPRAARREMFRQGKARRRSSK